MQEEEKKKNKKDKQKEIEELNLKIKSLEEEVLRSKEEKRILTRFYYWH